MTVFIGVLLAFLLILGISQLWEWLLLYSLRPKKEFLRYEIIPLQGEVQELEQLLRYVRQTSVRRDVLIVDVGLDEESRELCRQLCARCPELHFLNSQEAKMLIFPENDLEGTVKK